MTSFTKNRLLLIARSDITSLLHLIQRSASDVDQIGPGMWLERSQEDPLSNRIDFWIIGVTKPARQLVVGILGHLQTVLEGVHLSIQLTRQTLKFIDILFLRPDHITQLLHLALVRTWIVVMRPVLLDGLEHRQIIRLVLDVKLALAERTLGLIALITTSHLPLLSTRQASLVIVLAHCNALIDCLSADAAGEVLFQRLVLVIIGGHLGVFGTELGLHVGTLGCSARPWMTLAVADWQLQTLADVIPWQLQTL